MIDRSMCVCLLINNDSLYPHVHSDTHMYTKNHILILILMILNIKNKWMCVTNDKWQTTTTNRNRCKKDKRTIMTKVLKKAAPESRTRSLDDDLVVALSKSTGTIHTHTLSLSLLCLCGCCVCVCVCVCMCVYPFLCVCVECWCVWYWYTLTYAHIHTHITHTHTHTKGQLLLYANNAKRTDVKLDLSCFDYYKTVQFRYDLMDTHIDICAPEVSSVCVCVCVCVCLFVCVCVCVYVCMCVCV